MVPTQGFVSVSRRPPDVEDYIDMLRRYRSWIIGPMFAGLVIAVVVAFFWPDVCLECHAAHHAAAGAGAPGPQQYQYADRPAPDRDAAEILSRTSLSELIQRPSMDLYRKERLRTPMEDVIEGMRRDIKITILDVPTTPGQGHG